MKCLLMTLMPHISPPYLLPQMNVVWEGFAFRECATEHPISLLF